MDKEFVVKKKSLLFAVYIFLYLLAIIPNVSAGLILPGNDSLHIALAQDRGYVLPFYRGSDQFNLNFAGSITIIDDGSWGLVAKHQVLQTFSDPSSFYGSYGTSVTNNYLTNPGTKIAVKSVFVFDDIDMTLVQFNAPINGVTPIQRYRGDVAIGTEGHITGFGVTQYVNDPNVNETGDRMTGFDVVQQLNTSTFTTRFNRSFDPNYRPLEMGLRTGDSGGAFEVFDSGRFLAGLNTATTGAGANGFATGSFYTYIPNARIDAIQQITAVPEPNSLILLSTIGPLFGRFRRRFKGH